MSKKLIASEKLRQQSLQRTQNHLVSLKKYRDLELRVGMYNKSAHREMNADVDDETNVLRILTKTIGDSWGGI